METPFDGPPTKLTFRLTDALDGPPLEAVYVEVRAEVTDEEMQALMVPHGEPYPVPYEYEQKRVVYNWNGSSTFVEWAAQLMSLPSLGDWFLFGLGLWLANRTKRATPPPEEGAGERAARMEILRKREKVRDSDLVRTGYESNRETGHAIYEFEWGISRFRVAVAVQGSEFEIPFFIESTRPVR